MERLRTIIFLLPAVLSKRNCCLDFPQLDQKLRNAVHSVAMSTTWVIIGPTLWPFLRANPRRQRYARSCRNTSVQCMLYETVFSNANLKSFKLQKHFDNRRVGARELTNLYELKESVLEQPFQNLVLYLLTCHCLWLNTKCLLK